MKKIIKQSEYASESLMRKRIRRFKMIKRGYYSFLIILFAYIASFFAPMLMNNKALIVKYDGRLFFPVFKYYGGAEFGQDIYGETDYRILKRQFQRENKGNWVVMPPYPYGPNESLTDTDAQYRLDDVRDRYKLVQMIRDPQDDFAKYVVAHLSPDVVAKIEKLPEYLDPPRRVVKAVLKDLNKILAGPSLYNHSSVDHSKLTQLTHDLAAGDMFEFETIVLNRNIVGDLLSSIIVKNRQPPTAPSWQHWLGTDDRGRDVFVRIFYGFNISLTFSILLVFFTMVIGIIIGAAQGYYGGKFDILSQRLIEVWGAIPFLYTVIIIASIVRPNFTILLTLLILLGWAGMTYFMRGEFYREKARDYVHAAIAMGVSDRKILFKHILPNAMTPIIASFPFRIVGGIGSLVGLDYLGFGLPPPTPSWGELVNQGMQNIFTWWLVVYPLGAMFVTLLLVVFIGEAIRQAFDPREYSRLR